MLKTFTNRIQIGKYFRGILFFHSAFISKDGDGCADDEVEVWIKSIKNLMEMSEWRFFFIDLISNNERKNLSWIFMRLVGREN